MPILGGHMVAVGALASVAGGQASEESLCRWFDSLKIAGLRGKPFVEVEMWYGEQPQSPQHVYRLSGFLVKKSAEGGRVFNLRLAEEEFPPPNWMPKGARTRVTVIPLEDWARDRFEEIERHRAGWTNLMGPSVGASRVELFVMWALLRARGESPVAARLWERVQRHDPFAPVGKPVEHQIKEEVATLLMYEATRVTAEPSYLLAEVERQFRFVAENFPKSVHFAMAAEFASSYRSQLALPKPGRLSEAQIRGLAPHCQAQERISRLVEFADREEQGSIYRLTPEGSQGTPMKALLDLGWAAVPALIDALGDRRLTRIVQFDRRMEVAPSPNLGRRILRVGDVALRLLQQLSNNRIAPEGEFKSWESRAESCQRFARDWWANYGPKGEKAYLISEVAAGGSGAYVQARRLIERHPQDAFAAIREGIKNSLQPGSLVGSLLLVPNEERFDVAKEIIRSSKDESAFFSACRLLAIRDLPAATRAVADYLHSSVDSELGYSRSAMIEFLLGSGLPNAVRAVRKEMTRATMYVRYSAAEVLLFDLPPKRWPVPTEAVLPKDEETRKEYRQEVEGLLTDLLDDVTVHDGAAINLDGTYIWGPRIADLAQCALAKYFPGRYRFRGTNSPLGMEIQRIANLNVVRLRLGHELALPVPKMPEPAPVNRELLNQLDNAPSQVAFDAALALARSYGLRSLPTLVRLADSPSMPINRRVRIKEAASELAKTVRLVEIDGRRDLASRWISRLNAVGGQSFQTEWLKELVFDAMTSWPAELGSLRISVTGEGNMTGLAVKVSFLPATSVKLGGAWGHSERVQAGSRVLYQSGGSGGISDRPLRLERLAWFMAALDEANRSAADQVINASFRISRPETWPQR